MIIYLLDENKKEIEKYAAPCLRKTKGEGFSYILQAHKGTVKYARYSFLPCRGGHDSPKIVNAKYFLKHCFPKFWFIPELIREQKWELSLLPFEQEITFDLSKITGFRLYVVVSFLRFVEYHGPTVVDRWAESIRPNTYNDYSPESFLRYLAANYTYYQHDSCCFEGLNSAEMLCLNPRVILEEPNQKSLTEHFVWNQSTEQLGSNSYFKVWEYIRKACV